MHSKRLQERGFTLLELMITLGIVSIIAVAALPSMGNILGDSEVTASSNQLVFGLQSARSEAIKRITPVGLCPSAKPMEDTPTCGSTFDKGWFVFVDDDGSGVRNDEEQVLLQQEAFSSAFTVTVDELYENGVLFSISGTSVNAAGVPRSGGIVVAHQSIPEKRRVSIAASGRISVGAPVAATSNAADVTTTDDSD